MVLPARRSRALKGKQAENLEPEGWIEGNAWLLMVGLSAVLVYINALGNGFVYDDHFLVERSWLIQNRDFGSVFTTHYWAGYAGNETGHYRPIAVLTLLLDSLGGVIPFRFHLTNVILHTVNSILAFLVCRAIGLDRVAAGIAGLLFAVHPVHAEVAAGVTFGRSDLLAGGFLLASLLLYIYRSRTGKLHFYIGSLVAFFLGLISKESALTLIGLIVLYDFGRSRCGWKTFPGVIAQSWRRWTGFLAVFGLVLVTRRVAAGLGFSPDSMSVLVNPLFGASLGVRLLTAAKLFWNYAVLLVFPADLSVDYSYNAIPVAGFPPDITVYAGIGLALIILTLWLRSFGKSPIVFLCGALFWVPYSAVSQTVVLLNSMCQERFLYVPVLGVFALAGLGGEYLLRRFRQATIIGLCLIVGGYAFRTIVRNRDWKDDITLFTSAVSTYPGSAKMHHAIADVYAEKGYLDEAILGFRHALGIREEAMTYNNLGNAYGLKGAYVPARAAYRKATDIEPEFAEAWMNLGVTALRIGEVEVAAEAFGRAADLKSDDEETQFNLARSLEGMQEFVGAVEAYERALVLRPDWPEALFNLGKVYSELGNSQKALDRYERFLSVWKGDLQFKDAARMRIRDLQDRGRGEAGF